MYYCTDPLELAADEPAMALRRSLYRGRRRRSAGCLPLAIQPDVPWLHVLQQPTARGTAHVVFHTAAGGSPQQIGIPTSAGRGAAADSSRLAGLAVTTTRADVS